MALYEVIVTRFNRKPTLISSEKWSEHKFTVKAKTLEQAIEKARKAENGNGDERWLRRQAFAPEITRAVLIERELLE